MGMIHGGLRKSKPKYPLGLIVVFLCTEHGMCYLIIRAISWCRLEGDTEYKWVYGGDLITGAGTDIVPVGHTVSAKEEHLSFVDGIN